jgi:hypothetical protein
MSSKYDQVIKEALGEEPDSLTQWNNQKTEEEKETYGDQGPKIHPVGDIFDTYEEVGISAEIGLNDLISATVEDIVRQVPKESQTNARIAVKKMWLDIIKNWKSFEGYER